MTRGEIYLFNFGDPFGSEPGYLRPVMIAQSGKENLENLNTTVVIPLTKIEPQLSKRVRDCRGAKRSCKHVVTSLRSCLRATLLNHRLQE